MSGSKKTKAAGSIGTGILAVAGGVGKNADDVAMIAATNADDAARFLVTSSDDVLVGAGRFGDDLVMSIDDVIPRSAGCGLSPQAVRSARDSVPGTGWRGHNAADDSIRATQRTDRTATADFLRSVLTDSVDAAANLASDNGGHPDGRD